jgi:hypothetical protein
MHGSREIAAARKRTGTLGTLSDSAPSRCFEVDTLGTSGTGRCSRQTRHTSTQIRCQRGLVSLLFPGTPRVAPGTTHPPRLSRKRHRTRDGSGLLEREDLLLEVELLEHVDVGGEPVDVVGEVVRKAVGISEQVGEGVVRGVVEGAASGLLHLDLEPVRVVVRRRQLADGGPVGLEDAVQASQDGEWEDDVAVLVGAVGASGERCPPHDAEPQTRLGAGTGSSRSGTDPSQAREPPRRTSERLSIKRVGLLVGGAGGNRTRVLERRTRSSPGAVRGVAFLGPGARTDTSPTGPVTE